MLKATKIRLYPTREQRDALRFQFGAVRWVYNDTLALRQRAWQQHRQSITERMTLDRLVELKKQAQTAWLKDADSQALQQAVMHLDDAFQRFFQKKARYPKFKTKYGKQSLSYPQRVKLVDQKLYLPKVGWVKAHCHRTLKGRIKTVTVSLTPTGKYFASILGDDGLGAPKPPQVVEDTSIVGIDLGLNNLTVDCTGQAHANPRFANQAARNLRRKQKALSRKKKGSANRNKARLKVAKAHERMANARHDYQHKLSKHLVDKNHAICVETLRVKNMLKNRRLARSISDAAWGELVRKLEYKCKWYGKHLVRMDPFYPSSKTCSHCGSKLKTLELDVRGWTCIVCGTRHDRDINAAINIKAQGILQLKAAGLSVSACGSSRKARVGQPSLAAAREAGSLSL